MATCSGCSGTSDPPRPGGVTRAGLFCLGLLFLLLGGCAGARPQGESGNMVHTDAVTRLFETNTVLPDHVYYYCGPEAEPEAIIGIHSGFAFQGRYWYQVPLTPEKLQSWNRRIDNAHRIRFAYKGAWILTPDGRQAGVWYSKFEHTVIRFPAASTILLYTPGPPPSSEFLQGDFDDRGSGGGRGPRN